MPLSDIRHVAAALLLLFAAMLPQAATAVPPIEAYGKLPGLDQAAISPSGNRYALVGRVGEERRLILCTATGEALKSFMIGKTKLRAISWASEDIVLVTVSDTYNLGLDFSRLRYELTQVLAINVKDGKVISVLNDEGMFGGVFGDYGTALIGGRIYGFFGGIALGKDARTGYYWQDGNPELYRVDLETGEKQRIAKGAERGAYRDWLLDDSGAIVATLDHVYSSGLWRISTGRGVELARGIDKDNGVGFVGLGRRAGTIVYTIESDDGRQAWIELALDGSATVPLLPDEDVLRSWPDRSSRLLAGYVRDSDLSEDVFFDPLRQARIRGTRKAFPGVATSLESANDAFDRLIVRTSGIGDSGTWWIVDVKSGQANEIGRSYPQVRSADVGPMRMVDYKAADGLALRGVLTLPPGHEDSVPGRKGTALPLVVLPHGGPAARDYPAFNWLAQAFASRGYAVFQPNFRGSTGYGSAVRVAGRGEWGRKMQSDISAGVEALAAQGIVDPRRACIVGASYGGYAALAGVTIEQGRYRCAVSIAGVSDIPAFLNYALTGTQSASTLIREWRRDIGSTRDTKDISPNQLAGRADAPVLLIHGKLDTVVPIQQSWSMQHALHAAGKPVEIVTLDSEDHWLSREPTRVATLAAAVAFVERHNPAMTAEGARVAITSVPSAETPVMAH